MTGFGLLGHATHIARASKVALRIHVSRVPTLAGTREAWRAGARTGGAERNEEYLRDRVKWGGATDEDRAVLVDPQTSGGLLVAVSAEGLGEYLSAVPTAVEIGEVVEPSDRDVVLD